MRILAVLGLVLAVRCAAAGTGAWEALGPSAIGRDRAAVGAAVALACDQGEPLQRCTAPLTELAGVPVRGLEAGFRDGRLAWVTVRLDPDRYAAALEAVRARLGEPEDRSFRARAGMAGDFEAGVQLWNAGDVAVVLEQYAGKIDRGALRYGDARAMAELVARKRAYPPGAWRDL